MLCDDKKYHKKGTLIMDDSNFLSMDPVNIFKSPGNTIFKKNNKLL